MLTAAMVAALLVITGGGLCLGSAVIARHRAQAAADLAALAAAARLPAGAAAACGQAVLVARLMAARHAECRADGLDVVVTVEVPAMFTGRGIGPARAAARAGPVVGGHPQRGPSGKAAFRFHPVDGHAHRYPAGGRPGSGLDCHTRDYSRIIGVDSRRVRTILPAAHRAQLAIGMRFSRIGRR